MQIYVVLMGKDNKMGPQLGLKMKVKHSVQMKCEGGEILFGVVVAMQCFSIWANFTLHSW